MLPLHMCLFPSATKLPTSTGGGIKPTSAQAKTILLPHLLPEGSLAKGCTLLLHCQGGWVGAYSNTSPPIQPDSTRTADPNTNRIGVGVDCFNHTGFARKHWGLAIVKRL